MSILPMPGAPAELSYLDKLIYGAKAFFKVGIPAISSGTVPNWDQGDSRIKAYSVPQTTKGGRALEQSAEVVKQPATNWKLYAGLAGVAIVGAMLLRGRK